MRPAPLKLSCSTLSTSLVSPFPRLRIYSYSNIILEYPMSIPEALKGAQAELARIPSPIDKLRRIASYVRIIGAELLGSVTMIPYGARALTLHRSLPEATLTGGRTGSVSLARSKHYAAGPRNTLDIYLPADTDLGPSADPKTPKPIVLFCHGGIWATGEAWHYAPMAVRLAQAGIITAVMQYTLYPQAIAPRMAEEVSQALTWTMEHAGSLGGDAQRVTLVGHSAGAQLCAMALLHRAAAACGQALGSVRSDGGGAPDAYSDARMPCQFVGMAGVFDIAKHFQYEEGEKEQDLKCTSLNKYLSFC